MRLLINGVVNWVLLARRALSRRKGNIYITYEYNRGRPINPNPCPWSGLRPVQEPIAWSSSPRALESGAYQALRSIVKEPPSEGVTLPKFRFAPPFELTAAQVPTPPSGCSGLAGPSCLAMPLLPYVPSGLCKYCLYEYTHVLLSCCTLLRPIGM